MQTISSPDTAPKYKDMERVDIAGRPYLYDAKRKRAHLRYVGPFRSPEDRERYAQQILDERATKVKRHEEMVQRKREVRRTTLNPFAVGTFLSYSWGYDQTNMEYAKVIATTRGTVTIQHVKMVYLEQRGAYGDKVAPDMLSNSGKVERITLQTSGRDLYLPAYHGHSWSAWDGKADYQTDPMFGH